MRQCSKKKKTTRIPTKFTKKQFKKFILPHLSIPKRGPKCKIGYFRVFNYILYVLHTGIQWDQLPIEKGKRGKAEIHYTGIYKIYARWSSDGSWAKAFEASVKYLSDRNKLDTSILHGDGSNT